MNNQIVSKGWGPNKKDAKTAAAQILLQVICPNIFKEWKEKLKTHSFDPLIQAYVDNYVRSTNETSGINDVEMIIEQTTENDRMSSSHSVATDKENTPPQNEIMNVDQPKKEVSPLIQQFQNEVNAKQISEQQFFQEETIANQEEFFTSASLQDIADNKDAHIDDPDLFLKKKDLLGKFTPLSVIHAISGKQPQLGINHKNSDRKNPNDERTMLFSHFVNMPDKDVKGFAEE